MSAFLNIHEQESSSGLYIKERYWKHPKCPSAGDNFKDVCCTHVPGDRAVIRTEMDKCFSTFIRALSVPDVSRA